MTDLMNGEQYKKACRYRMQETWENLSHLWEQPKEIADNRMIEKTMAILGNTLDELKYFREKLSTTGDDETGVWDEPENKDIENELKHNLK